MEFRIKRPTTFAIALSSLFVTAPLLAAEAPASKLSIYDEVGLIEPTRPLLQQRLDLKNAHSANDPGREGVFSARQWQIHHSGD